MDDHIKRINYKLQKLLNSHRTLQKEKERQSRLITELQASKEKDNREIEALQEQVNILKMATGQLDEPDKKEFEIKISRYIREIDKCIGLLSK